MIIVCAKSKTEVVDSIDVGELKVQFDGLMGKFKDLLRIREEEAVARLSLRQSLEEYKSARAEIFKEKLQAEGNGWCGVCSSIHKRDVLRLIYKELWDYENLDYPDGIAEFMSARLVLACQNCYKKDSRTFFMSPLVEHYFEVRSQNDKYFALLPEQHNYKRLYLQGTYNWRELDERAEIVIYPRSIPSNIAKLFKLPPAVELVERQAGSLPVLNSDGTYSYYTKPYDGDDYLNIIPNK